VIDAARSADEVFADTRARAQALLGRALTP